MLNFRIIWLFLTDLGFFKKLGQLGPPKHPFWVWIKKTYFTNNFDLVLGYSHAKFQNNLVIFDLSRISPKIGQLGPPKPPFLTEEEEY